MSSQSTELVRGRVRIDSAPNGGGHNRGFVAFVRAAIIWFRANCLKPLRLGNVLVPATDAVLPHGESEPILFAAKRLWIGLAPHTLLGLSVASVRVLCLPPGIRLASHLTVQSPE